MAFHLGCLRAVKELGLLDKIEAISTISGGSVIGAYYAYTPEKTFDEFETDIRKHLRKGFQKGMMLRISNPINMTRGLRNVMVDGYDFVREKIFRGSRKFDWGARARICCGACCKSVSFNKKR